MLFGKSPSPTFTTLTHYIFWTAWINLLWSMGACTRDIIHGYTYCVSFEDAFSRYTWIYFVKQKSETLSIFKQFKTLVELQLNKKIKSVQSDWGGEFRSFTQYLATFGIVHRLICPHTHHQNGVVERKQKHIVEIGLTLLYQASLPIKFWDHSFHTAIYLINRLPSIAQNNTIPF